jgi:hypothetical protein
MRRSWRFLRRMTHGELPEGGRAGRVRPPHGAALCPASGPGGRSDRAGRAVEAHRRLPAEGRGACRAVPGQGRGRRCSQEDRRDGLHRHRPHDPTGRRGGEGVLPGREPQGVPALDTGAGDVAAVGLGRDHVSADGARACGARGWPGPGSGWSSRCSTRPCRRWRPAWTRRFARWAECRLTA